MLNTYISVYEKSMPDTLSLNEKMLTAKKAGYYGLEISIDETDYRLSRVLDREEKNKTLLQIREGDLPIRTMCLSGQRKYPFGSLNPVIREKSLEIVKCAIDFSVDAGISIIQIPGYDVYYEPSNLETEKYFTEGLFKATEYAEKSGIVLAFETMENDFMNTVGKAMKYVNLINSKALKIYPDLGNIRNGTDDYITDLQLGRGHIVAIHLKETKEGVFRNLEFGQGRVDFTGCIKELLTQGVNIYNCEIWHDSKTEPIEFIKRNLNYIQNCFAKI